MSSTTPPIINRQQKLPAAPSGREVKRILLEQTSAMLDNIFHNHHTYPNALILITVEAQWMAIQAQAKSLALESHIEGPLTEEQQRGLEESMLVKEDDGALEQREVNMNPRAQTRGQGVVEKKQLKGKAAKQQVMQTSAPAQLAPESSQPAIAPGLVARSAASHIVNTQSKVGEVPKEAQKAIEEGEIARDAVGQLQTPQEKQRG